jgi:hypothetical protein
VGDRLDQLLLGRAVVLRVLKMEGQLVGVAAGGQRGDGDQLRSFGDSCGRFQTSPKEHGVGDVHQRRGEITEQLLGARGLGVLVVSAIR